MEGILNSHTKKFIIQQLCEAGIKDCYGKTKPGLVNLMLDNKSKFSHIEMSENKRSAGGMKGRNEGLESEKIVKNYLEKNNTKVKTLLKDKHNIISKKIIWLYVDELRYKYQDTINKLPENFKNYMENYGRPKDNKRAADIILLAESEENNIYHFGFDNKKYSKSNSQLCCKSMNTFWNNYVDKNCMPSLQQYLSYNGKTRKFDKNHKDFENIKTDLWKIMQNVKINLIKKRDDSNELYFVDYIIQLNNDELKFVNVDSILSLFNYEPKISEQAQSNFCFHNYITIKPHGSSRQNPQINLSCKIFNDNELSFCL
jgi:hypothetical protein